MDYTWIIVIGIGLAGGLVIRLYRKGKLTLPERKKSPVKMTGKDGNKLYGCTLCSRWYPTIEDLQEHSLQEHQTIVSIPDANYRVKVVDEETYTEAVTQQAEKVKLEEELREVQKERIADKLLQDQVLDKAIVVREGDTPSSVCAQIVSLLQESNVEQGLNGSIQTTIKDNQIYYRAELILPHSEQNLQAITTFAAAVKR